MPQEITQPTTAADKWVEIIIPCSRCHGFEPECVNCNGDGVVREAVTLQELARLITEVQAEEGSS